MQCSANGFGVCRVIGLEGWLGVGTIEGNHMFLTGQIQNISGGGPKYEFNLNMNESVGPGI